jgi:hypothetical protein
MTNDRKNLIQQLRESGLSKQAIEAAWPSWWSDAAETSPSARAELRFAIARSLGLSPRSLIGERVDFVWRDKARFKNLDQGTSDFERAALNSFGMATGGLLLRGTALGEGLLGLSALGLREAILSGGQVDLLGILSTCWGTGVPVAHLSVSPLPKKAMHAMVVSCGGRHAVLLSRKASYPALTAFTLAHEIGHIALGHVPADDMLVDADDPSGVAAGDEEEEEANKYALELLLGDSNPDIQVNIENFNSAELADAVLRIAPAYGIEPGTLALVVAKRYDAWPVAMAAMRFIYKQPMQVARVVNSIAINELDFGSFGEDGAEFMHRILGSEDV